MKLKDAVEIVGGLSAPSKMPCHGYSIPASKCITGSKLREVDGSICSKCYALKGRYAFANVQNALFRRFESLENPLWIDAMAFLINHHESGGFFRWHDSGDLQSVDHLARIVAVCRLTPTVRHWLPTREFGIIGDYLRQGGTLPENLTVRLSTLLFDALPPAAIAARFGVQTSGASATSFSCPASTQGNICGTCRACWDKSVSNVNYKKH